MGGARSIFVGILVMIVGLIITGCGRDPQLKVADPDRGQFAIDFSRAIGGMGSATFENPDFPNIENKELTIEAWVKSRSGDLNGGIFGRLDSHGIGLYIKNNEPKMVIRRNPIATELRCSNLTTTTTECIVESNFSLVKDVWTHIAGVLTNEDQSGGPNDCTTVGSEQPHLAIYINGELRDCATTESRFAINPPEEYRLLTIGYIGTLTEELAVDGMITGRTRFDGVIDEVRFWGVARTQEEIQACMNQELSISTPGDCYIDPSILLGYWRLNEGEGDQVFDISGNRNMGVLAIGLTPWVTGWVEGAPITRDPGY